MTQESREIEVDVAGVDPWGLRRVERLLHTVEGVDSLKIVPDARGGIDEVHVLSSSDLGAKQIVRNIESALLAQFGLQVDHRKVSVAQVRPRDLPRRDEEEEAEAEAGRPDGARRILLEGFQMERRAGERVLCKVRLRDVDDDEVFEGAHEGPDYSKSRLEVTAQALLNALNQASDGRATFAVEGVAEVEVFGRRLIAVLVQGFSGRHAIALPGVSKIHDSVEEGVVLACLSATNRWVAELL